MRVAAPRAVSFAFTTLADEPATAVAMVVILVLCIGLDLGWKRRRGAALRLAPSGQGHPA